MNDELLEIMPAYAARGTSGSPEGRAPWVDPLNTLSTVTEQINELIDFLVGDPGECKA